MTQPNTELAYQVLDHIKAYPEEWYQGTWYAETMCGTRACFAGHAVILAGGEIVKLGGFISPHYRAILPGSEDRLFIEEAARSVLKIGMRDAEDLFGGGNAFDDLEEYVRAFFGPRPTVQEKGSS